MTRSPGREFHEDYFHRRIDIPRKIGKMDYEKLAENRNRYNIRTRLPGSRFSNNERLSKVGEILGKILTKCLNMLAHSCQPPRRG